MFLKNAIKIFLVVCLIVLLQDYSKDNITYINNQINLNDYYNEIKSNTSFIATLEIDKIKLKQGLYPLDSKYNNVEYGLEIINGSNLPDKSNILIIASHSGNSKIAYFNNLDKIKVNDIVKLSYQNKNYQYQIYDIYEIEKSHKLKLPEFEEKTICLLTCDKQDKSKQVVYLGKLNI